MPDWEVITADGPKRIFTFLHKARPFLLNLKEGARFEADRVQVIDAKYEGPWELPVISKVERTSAMLIRPDGHVAWAGEPDDPTLREALATWF
jgi:hypothetical protein